ncbi:hypothetical protein C3R44_21205, partial [Mycobacterium tuberculosis]
DRERARAHQGGDEAREEARQRERPGGQQGGQGPTRCRARPARAATGRAGRRQHEDASEGRAEQGRRRE